MLLVNWTNTFIITIMGFTVVFCILTILVFVIKAFGHVMAPKVKKSQVVKVVSAGTKSIPVSKGEHIPALDSAAIATALHLYLDDAHDKESYILRISKVARRYSPWNSKIYGLNYINK